MNDIEAKNPESNDVGRDLSSDIATGKTGVWLNNE
jgi:hypothetical protein